MKTTTAFYIAALQRTVFCEIQGQAAADALCCEIISDTCTCTTDVERFRARCKAILYRLEGR